MKNLVIILLLFAATPSQAQTGFEIPIKIQCNTTKIVVEMLRDKYREVPTGGGMSMREQVRLFESHDAGDKQTWTLVISNPNGLSCVIKGGQDWIADPEIIKGDPL